MEKFELKPTSAVEQEKYLPQISTEERRFIEDVGGEYSGYVRSEEDQRRYEHFRIDRRAHYDEKRREVIETYIATEAIDEDGEKDLRSPVDSSGFSILVGELSRSGKEIGEPQILMVRAGDFRRQISPSDLEQLAREVHALASHNAVTLDSVGLRSAVEKYLRSVGWER